MKIKNNEFHLDCHEVTLYLQGKEEIQAKGCGYIEATKRGELVLKAYVDSGISEKLDKFHTKKNGSGKIIKKDDLFGVKAIDNEGNLWTSEDIFPSDISFHKSIHNRIYSSKLYSATKINDMKPLHNKDTNISLLFFEAPELPRNIIGNPLNDKDNISHSKNAICKFIMDNCIVILATEDYGFKLSALCTKNDCGKILERRLGESLQFLLGRNLWWNVMTRFESSKEYTTVRSNDHLKHNRAGLAPLLDLWHPDNREDIDSLFTRYYDFVSRHDQSAWHPLSCLLYSIYESTEEATAIALNVSVAVEGAINIFHHKDQCCNSHLKQQCSRAKTMIENSDLDESIKKRLGGFLGSIQRTSISDKLNSLEKQGIIREHDIKAWKKLRNRFAHGNISSDISLSEYQQIHSLSNKCLTLLHLIIMNGIGYSGKFTDYSECGWPKRHTSDFAL
ncbi:MAG: hypothetical protein JXR97_12425 [Planctomycetes bacterium]|nr:hypothetical protein [Planctomycetota bacterium]